MNECFFSPALNPSNFRNLCWNSGLKGSLFSVPLTGCMGRLGRALSISADMVLGLNWLPGDAAVVPRHHNQNSTSGSQQSARLTSQPALFLLLNRLIPLPLNAPPPPHFFAALLTFIKQRKSGTSSLRAISLWR